MCKPAPQILFRRPYFVTLFLMRLCIPIELHLFSKELTPKSLKLDLADRAILSVRYRNFRSCNLCLSVCLSPDNSSTIMTPVDLASQHDPGA